jgi:hypothetical protein
VPAIARIFPRRLPTPPETSATEHRKKHRDCSCPIRTPKICLVRTPAPKNIFCLECAASNQPLLTRLEFRANPNSKTNSETNSEYFPRDRCRFRCPRARSRLRTTPEISVRHPIGTRLLAPAYTLRQNFPPSIRPITALQIQDLKTQTTSALGHLVLSIIV